jgi:HTH-type transcriptional regulator / antitoxin HigA
MDIRPIRNDTGHEAARREIEMLWGAADGSEAGDRLDVLVTLVEAYESRRWPIAPLDPVQAIEAAMAMIRKIAAWRVPDKVLVQEYALAR